MTAIDLGNLKVVDFKVNEIVLDVQASRSVFYYSDGYNEPWKVYIAGKKDKIYKTNLAFKSVIVKKGNLRVHFKYSPDFYKFSLACYFAGWLILTIMLGKIIVKYLKHK